MGKIKLGRYRDFLYTMYTHKSEVFKFSLGIKVPDKHWDAIKKTPKKTLPYYEEANILIQSGLSEMINATIECRRLKLEPTVQNIRFAFNTLRENEKKSIFGAPQKRDHLEDQFNRFLEFKLKSASANHMKNLEQCKRVALEFEQEFSMSLTPPEFNKDVFDVFLYDFLIGKKGYQDRTVEKHVSSFGNFLRWGYSGDDFKYVNYSKNQIEFPIFLNDNEIELLIHSELYGRFDKTRDLLLFLCTTGMRYGDSQDFHEDLIEDGVIEYVQKKTGTVARPPVKNITREIIKKYGGKAPTYSDQKFNTYLKQLFTKLGLNRKVKKVKSVSGKTNIFLIPLDEIVSSHIGRKTFITLSLMKGIPIQDVMKMSGHSDYSEMRPYIEVTKTHLKDSASRWDI